MSRDVDVAVVGAGIAGLTAAHELRRAGLDVRVYEAAGQVGGRMMTARRDGYAIDTGAEQVSPHGYPATWDLLRRLDFRAEDVPAIGRPIGMWRDGRAHLGFGSARGLVTGAGLSARARLDLPRLAVDVDPERPEASDLGDTTVAELARRHHRDLGDYLLQPAASFCLWDPEKSSAAVLLGMQRAVGATSGWRTYRDGMDTPCRRMATELDVVTGQEVTEVVADGTGARLRVGPDVVSARQVLLCVPAPIAARLHPGAPPAEAEFLAACTFSSAIKVPFLLDAPVELPGRPYLVITPRAEEEFLAAILFDHLKHPRRVPAGKGLVTAVINVANTAGLLDAPDHEIIARTTEAIRRYLPIRGEAQVHRHRCALPECTPAALAALPAFRDREPGPVDYAGDWVNLRPHSEGAVRTAALAVSRTLSRLGSPIPV
ncbi:protoporphyrinogen/coproporphyrinogen oxidase [Saccharopolyspora flava]|uniref:Oxygen-dependent protoporphyrinogen oxidase n=1 Tax=Saccharopolyspora flava TaxID=95161 RepID=A0A1I6S8P7_9PSEU|nr:NAD(P)/FAD-dependent oxidoreductase [Saccharopolyspora flava]SFS73138.1 oxygen-dependent protoporphyrinogen oxidase [Saccharopolyspora flava]